MPKGASPARNREAAPCQLQVSPYGLNWDQTLKQDTREPSPWPGSALKKSSPLTGPQFPVTLLWTIIKAVEEKKSKLYWKGKGSKFLKSTKK